MYKRQGSLFAPDVMPIDCMFKLYPWEFMFAEDLTGCMTEMCWIEPLWKALMSDKAMLPVLYEMFPRSPYILSLIHISSSSPAIRSRIFLTLSISLS